MADRPAPARRILVLLAVLAGLAGLAGLMPEPAHAVLPEEVLDNPAHEARARAISKELRCVVCQNQSIDDSDADLARDLRVLVRQRIVEGDSDDEVIAYVVSRYGDFVLLRPPVKGATIVLWIGPIAIVLIGLLAMISYFRRASREAEGAGR